MEQVKAGHAGVAYGPLLVGEQQDSMLYWLARATREMRKARDRKQVHVAASAGVDQSTIWRWEQAVGWPRNIDAVIAAYADDFEIEPLVIWEHALELWRASDLDDAEALERDEEEAVRQAAERDAAPAPSGRTRRQKG
jgi:transcriptional regulator with XRE-family HTH domain